jgi:rod shape-determining protein MreD
MNNTQRFPGIRPRQSVWRRLDMAARRSFPASATALVLLVTAAPLGLPGQVELQVSAALCCVFFWSLFRPASMPPVAVFLLGLLTDLLGYAPPGVNVLTMLLAHGMGLRWRRDLVRLGFLMVWVSFVGVSIGAAALSWALTSLLTFRLLQPGEAVFQAALGAGLYPLLAVLLTRAHQTLAEPEHA